MAADAARAPRRQHDADRRRFVTKRSGICSNRPVGCARTRSDKENEMKGLLRELQIQRWDDHRYYHHSRINQSLHFVSASSFLCAYALLFFQPVLATLLGWFVAMTARQSGHFFFEPKGYDQVNQVSHEYKAELKVGYNLR